MLKKNNGIYNFQLKILLFFLCISLLHFEACYEDCKTCYDYSKNFNDMKCIDFKNDNFSILNDTTNCVQNNHYNDYYIKNNEDNITKLYPCSELDNTCYECDPELEATGIMGMAGICLSCNPGYKYINFLNICVEDKFYLNIILNDFDNCSRKGNDIFHFQYCNKYITIIDYNILLSRDIIICPDYAPIFNSYLNSCSEMDCPEEGFSNGKCIIYKKNIKIENFLFHGLMELKGKELIILV